MSTNQESARKTLGSFDVPHRTPAQRLCDKEAWIWGDCGDGSWFAQMVHAKDGRTWGNSSYFPTEWEAQRYAQLRARGHLDVGALMVLMEERTASARGGQS